MNCGNVTKALFHMILFLGSIAVACYAEEAPDTGLEPVLQEIKADYGVTLHYADGPKGIPAEFSFSFIDSANIEASKEFTRLFVQEVRLYPRNFFRQAGCRDIYFVQKLFYGEKPVDGVFLEGINTIIYDYARDNGKIQKIRHNIHHELYHMIGSRNMFWRRHVGEWESLNRADFTYARKFDPHTRNPLNFSAPTEPGFITDYAMTSSEEDRAEVFACLMIPEQHALLEEWSQKDHILLKKMELIKKFLQEGF